MQFKGSVIFAAAALSFAGAASAQKPASSAPPPAEPTTNGNTNGNNNPRQPSSTFPGGDSTAPQVIFISGTVVLSDGLPRVDDSEVLQHLCFRIDDVADGDHAEGVGERADCQLGDDRACELRRHDSVAGER